MFVPKCLKSDLIYDFLLFFFFKLINLLFHWNMEFGMIWICVPRVLSLIIEIQNKLCLIPFEVRVEFLALT